MEILVLTQQQYVRLCKRCGLTPRPWRCNFEYSLFEHKPCREPAIAALVQNTRNPALGWSYVALARLRCTEHLAEKLPYLLKQDLRGSIPATALRRAELLKYKDDFAFGDGLPVVRAG